MANPRPDYAAKIKVSGELQSIAPSRMWQIARHRRGLRARYFGEQTFLQEFNNVLYH